MENTALSYDKIITQIVDYVIDTSLDDTLAYETAYHSFLDAIACAILSLNYPACTQMLGPLVPGQQCHPSIAIPGTQHLLDPVQAAFNIGSMIRWLDFNDTWLAAEWGHPSDNLGGIIAAACYANLTQQQNYTLHDVFTSMIKAYEIQGILALDNAFNAVGLDHVMLVKIASTAVCGQLLNLNRQQLCAAVSNAWLDGQSLRTYRHFPNTGSRKSWAAGDATARALQLVLWTQRGAMGYPSAITANTWGFQDALFRGKPVVVNQPYGHYVMQNILWKITFPAEFHAQTAVECALQLHPQVVNRLNEIKHIDIETQAAGARIIDKAGPLSNPADRDHCLQYMIAIGLIHGELTAQHYEDSLASDPRIDRIRELMQVRENPAFTKAYFSPDQRAIPNAIQIHFQDGSSTERVQIDYPIGHRNRRQEGIPLLLQKFNQAIKAHYTETQAEAIISLCQNQQQLSQCSIEDFLTLYQQTTNHKNDTLTETSSR